MKKPITSKEIKEILDTSKVPLKEESIIMDYIYELEDKTTNLQEKLRVSQTNEETYRLEMQDITKLLGLDEHTTFDEVKEYATNLQEELNNNNEDIQDIIRGKER